jgi:hypothetical protein
MVMVTAALMVTGCGGGSESGSPALDAIEAERQRQAAAPVCAELYAEGEVTTAEHAESGCMEDGSLHVGGVAVHECTDGRTLLWSDWGWGFVGEPWSAHAAGAEQVAPFEARVDCGIAQPES